MAKAKKVKKTEGGDAQQFADFPESVYQSKEGADKGWKNSNKKKKKKKVRSFKPKKPVTGMLEAQGY